MADVTIVRNYATYSVYPDSRTVHGRQLYARLGVGYIQF